MIGDKDIKYFQDTILNWFEKNARIFPWRSEFLTAYEIIISETLLQRTKAETVAKFYPNFIGKFYNWNTLAAADLSDIETSLVPIGLYHQRAIRLKNLASFIVENNGKLPTSREELEKVPFMGQYIANAVELLINHKNKPLLDVNMARVLERYFGTRRLSDIRYDPYLQDLSHKIVNHSKAKSINWAILDFAATICKARNPSCSHCIFRDSCLFFQKNKV